MSKCFICEKPATKMVNDQPVCDECAEFLNNGPEQGSNPITLIESLAFVGVAGLGLAFTGLGVLFWIS